MAANLSKARRSPPVVRAIDALAEDISVWRRLRGLTQAQVAARAAVSERTVRRLESADGRITLENLLRVARALGVLERVVASFDPYETDVGRLRADEQLPRRVRSRNLAAADG